MPLKLNTMTIQQKNQHNEFKEAKKIALNIKEGECRRARFNDFATNYWGCKDRNGRMWVLGDTDKDIQNPDALINGKPAREVFGDFTVMTSNKKS